MREPRGRRRGRKGEREAGEEDEGAENEEEETERNKKKPNGKEERREREEQEGGEDQRRIKVIAQVRKESSFSFLVSEVERSISVISVMLNVRGLFARPVVGVEPVGGGGAGGREFGSRE